MRAAARRTGTWESCWPVLLVPAAVALGLAASRLGWNGLLVKSRHELIGPPLLAISLVLWTARARAARGPLFPWLAGLGGVFLVREIHFPGSDALTGAGLLALAVAAVRRRAALRQALAGWPERGWLWAALAGYVLSQLVARRVFRGLPGESALHVGIEELLETTAHLLFLGAALLARQRANAQAQPRLRSAASARTSSASA